MGLVGLVPSCHPAFVGISWVQRGEECGIYVFLFLLYIFTSYPQNLHVKKNLVDPRNSHEKKSWAHENTHEKKSWAQENTHEKKSWTHEKTTAKNFGPTKYSRKKNLDPQNARERKFRTYKIPKRKNFGPTTPAMV